MQRIRQSAITPIGRALVRQPPWLLVLFPILCLYTGEGHASLHIIQAQVGNQAGFNILNDDGHFYNGPFPDGKYGCAIGSGVIFLNSGTDSCHSGTDIRIPYGRANVNSNGTFDYHGRETTLINGEVYLKVPSQDRSAYLRASKGGGGKCSYRTIDGTVTESTVMGLLKLSLTPGSTVDSQEPDCLFCETDTLDCFSSFTAGPAGTVLYAGKGVGRTAVIVYNQTLGAAREIISQDYEIKYLSPNGTNVNSYNPIAVTYESFLKAGAPRRSDGSSSRRKRSPALAVAATLLALQAVAFDSTFRGFQAADANDRAIEKAINEGELALKKSAETLLTLRGQQYAQRVRQRLSNQENELTQALIESLTERTDALEQYVLFLGSYLREKSTQERQLEEDLVDQIKANNTDKTFLKYVREGNDLYITFREGEILNGNANASCGPSYCSVPGNFYKVLRPGKWVPLEDPIVQDGDCGIYVSTNDSKTITVFETAASLDGLKSYLERGQDPYFYTKPLYECQDKTVHLTNPFLGEAQRRLRLRGLGDLVQEAENRFKINCSNLPDNSSLKEDPVCQGRASIEDLKRFTSQLGPTAFAALSAAEVFAKTATDPAALIRALGSLTEDTVATLASLGGIAKDTWDSLINGNIQRASGLSIAAIVISCVSLIASVFLLIVILNQRKKISTLNDQLKELRTQSGVEYRPSEWNIK